MRRVAAALHARVRIVFEPENDGRGMKMAEAHEPYRASHKKGTR